MAKGQSLQDPYLNALRRERIPVSIYLVNGIKLQGQNRIIRPIRDFIKKTLLIKWCTNTLFQLWFQHVLFLTTIITAVIMQHKLLTLQRK